MLARSSASSVARMAECRLSPAAERDLEGIWKYTHEEWGREQAERYIDLLAAAFQVLADSPMSAPACDHIRLGYRRSSVERHMIYFRRALRNALAEFKTFHLCWQTFLG